MFSCFIVCLFFLASSFPMDSTLLRIISMMIPYNALYLSLYLHLPFPCHSQHNSLSFSFHFLVITFTLRFLFCLIDCSRIRFRHVYIYSHPNRNTPLPSFDHMHDVLFSKVETAAKSTNSTTSGALLIDFGDFVNRKLTYSMTYCKPYRNIHNGISNQKTMY